MDNNRKVLNHLFVNVFNQILRIEEKVIKQQTVLNLTVNEMHTIEAIGKYTSKNMSEVAELLNITTGTLTISVNRLIEKGYVERMRDEDDRRIVRIKLTDKGMKAFDKHEEYHEEMVNTVLSNLSDEEAEVLSRTLISISNFFKIKYES
ncbi:MAG: MarR family transcriptional regulator [Clostridiaceae bacterium]